MGPTLWKRPVERRRGMAMITVLLLLTTILYLAMSFLVRGNFNLFSATRDYNSIQAYYIANSGSVLAAQQFKSMLATSNDFAATLAANRGTVSPNYTLYDQQLTYKDSNNNNVVAGYYDVTIQTSGNSLNASYVDSTGPFCPQLPDSTQAFTYANSPYPYYDTVMVTATGSTQPHTVSGRVTRSVTYVLNVGPASDDAFDFAYAQNNWGWMSGFLNGYANSVGNTGSNGVFSVYGFFNMLGGGSNDQLVYSGNGLKYYQSLYAALGLNGQGAGTGTGVMSNGQQQNLQLMFPKNLWQVAQAPTTNGSSNLADGDHANPFYDQAVAQASANPNTGNIVVQTVTLTAKPDPQYGLYSANGSANFTVDPNTPAVTVMSGGVHGFNGTDNPNLVVGSTNANRNGNLIPFTASTAPTVLQAGDKVQLVTINGMNVVQGNVAVQGYVTGRGSVYAGRDMYVAGDVMYANPPSTYLNQSSPNTNINVPSGSPGTGNTPATGDFTKDQVLWAAGDSVVQGNVQSGSWWSDVSSWINYTQTDPHGNAEQINDGHEDYGLDNVVLSGDTGENDGKWTVSLVQATIPSGSTVPTPIPGTASQVSLSLKNVTNNQGESYKIPDPAQVPTGFSTPPLQNPPVPGSSTPGWIIQKGTGEDKDGDGQYQNPLTFTKDFYPASSHDSNGNYTQQPFTASTNGNSATVKGGMWDNFPNPSSPQWSKYVNTPTRIDGFLLANNALAGQTGIGGNIIYFGGEAGKEDAQFSNLGSGKLYFVQDLRFIMDPPTSQHSQWSSSGLPLYPRISFAGWFEQ
jgi:hypothetical protein